MLWLNIFCKSGGVICDVIYIYKPGTFEKRRQNFNKSIMIRKIMECTNNDARISVTKIEKEALYVIYLSVSMKLDKLINE